MKRIIISILLIFILLTGCGSNNKNIGFNELKEKMNNKDSFIVYFSGKDNLFKNKLNDIGKEYDLTIYTIDTNKISEEDKLNFQNKIDIKEEEIVFILNGQDPSKLSHVTDTSTSKKQIIQRLKDMHFINE